jgi:hypothetical protein
MARKSDSCVPGEHSIGAGNPNSIRVGFVEERKPESCKYVTFIFISFVKIVS